MRYLLINGSPHKGNTWKLAEIVKKNLEDLDTEAEFQEIHLLELNLPFCVGCSLCFRKGHEKCPHSNIMLKLIEAMDKADGIIFVTTTYCMRETALMKNFLDHLLFMMHRPHFFQSKALVITTTAGIGAKSSAKSVAGTLRGIGFNWCYLLYTTTFSWNDYRTDKRMVKKCKVLSSRFYADVLSGKLHSPKIELLIPYNLFRGMSLAYVKGTEYETEDGVYWTEPERLKGAYDKSIPLPYYKRIFGNLFYLIGKASGKYAQKATYKK